jgi:hypothetical protein
MRSRVLGQRQRLRRPSLVSFCGTLALQSASRLCQVESP